MYEMVIGLEVHIQLNTNTKIFCGCSTQFVDNPNINTCPVCQGHPGMLPVLNEEVVNRSLFAALATNSKINPRSLFDRKGYFYPDLPKGYQITQFYAPICEKGYVEIEKSNGDMKKIGIDHIHIEEDAGKLVHGEGTDKSSYVDLNRAGMPLLEVVSEPDIRDVEEAVLFATKLRQLMVYSGITDGNMQEGSMRFDVNLSLRPKGTEKFGTRTETKNLNSFTGLRKCIEMEFDRQKDLLEAGESVLMETRLFNVDKMESRSLRQKGEGELGYLYFRDPDIPALIISDERLKTVTDKFPKMPDFYLDLFVNDYGVKAEDALVLIAEKEYVFFFKEAVESSSKAQAQKIASFFLTDLVGILKDKKLILTELPLTPKNFGEIFALIEQGTISMKMAKEFLPLMVESGKSIHDIVKEKGATQISDEGELKAIIQDILKKNEDNVKAFQSGKTQVLGFFVGQVMKETKGKANPAMVNKILTQCLSEPL